MSTDFFGETLPEVNPVNNGVKIPLPKSEFFSESGKDLTPLEEESKRQDILPNHKITSEKLNARDDLKTCLKLLRMGILTKEQIQSIL